MSTNSRSPIFFFHVPKTGGCSVIQAAKLSLGRHHVFGLYDISFSSEDSRRLSSRVKKLIKDENIRFIHGHTSPANLSADLKVRRAVTLRDPLDRLISQFCYGFQYRHLDPNQVRFFLEYQMAGRKSFDASHVSDWIEHFKIDNWITRSLIAEMHLQINETHVQKAVTILKDMHFVGITSRLDGFLARLGDALVDATLPLVHANSSNRSVVQLTEQDKRNIRDTFLRHDMAVFEKATEMAQAPESQPAAGRNLTNAAGKPRTRKYLAGQFRHRNMREYLMRVQIQFAPKIRRWHEMLILLTRRNLGLTMTLSVSQVEKDGSPAI